MSQEITYKLCLRIFEKSNKFIFDLKEELYNLGIHSYSEGSFDNLESIDNEDCEKKRDEFLEADYLCDEILVHSYDRETLLNYKKVLEEKFPTQIKGEISELKTTDWRDKWKDSFKPIETKSYIVCPPWEKKMIDGKKTIIIEPAMAFGTGQHETTQICLELLEKCLNEKKNVSELSVMDLGTGSGILAIAACKSGVTKIDALDIDEDSVKACGVNAELNSIQFDAYKSDLSSYLEKEKSKTYDLILANILLPVLLKSLSDMARVTKNGSELILSGLIVSQKEEMLEACEYFGFVLIEERVKADWLGLRVVKK